MTHPDDGDGSGRDAVPSPAPGGRVSPRESVYGVGLRVASEQPVIDRQEVLSRTGFSASTLRRRMADRGFPRPVYVDHNAPRWIASEVDDWLRQHMPGRAAYLRAKGG